MKQQLIKLVFLYYCIFFGIPQTSLGQVTSSLSYEKKFTIYSSILDEDRTYYISLPDSYTDTDKNYPILILLDGYTFFKPTTGIVHFMSSSRNRNYLMPETIVIAIENVDRERDFTVTKLKTTRPNTMGGGKKFLKFIETELVPHIDKNYRTESHRTLVGHSLGGLLTLNAYLDENSLFDAFLAIDPSIWWDEKTMKEKVTLVESEVFTKGFYIATANQGGAKYERNKKRHDDFYHLLDSRSNGKFKAKLSYYENEDHRSVPLIAIYEGLKFLNQGI